MEYPLVIERAGGVGVVKRSVLITQLSSIEVEL